MKVIFLWASPKSPSRGAQVHTERVPRVHRTGDRFEAGNRSVLARRNDGLHRRAAVDVGEAHPLHGVQVIQVAPEFLKAVRRRQRCRVVAQVVLAELAGVVSEVMQQFSLNQLPNFSR